MRSRGFWVAIGFAVSLALAVAFAVGLVRGAARAPVAAEAPVGLDAREEIEALRAALESEAFEREMLAAEVELMRTVIERLAIERSEEESRADAGTASSPPTASPQQDALSLEEQLLGDIGLVEREVRELRDRWDAAVLARLELTDRATREGWLAKPRHRHQLALLEARLRADLGELDYDRMLYATGQQNRAVVQSVIGGSAAAIAGIEPGDHLISYAGTRAFRPKDLHAMTTSGVKGERVTVSVERRGRQLSFAVPRGPLGVRMKPARVPPVR